MSDGFGIWAPKSVGVGGRPAIDTISQPGSHSPVRSVSQSTSQEVSQSASQSVSQPANLPVGQLDRKSPRQPGPRTRGCLPVLVFCVASAFSVPRPRWFRFVSFCWFALVMRGISRPQIQVGKKNRAVAPTPVGTKMGGRRNNRQPVSQAVSTHPPSLPVRKSTSQETGSQSFI